MRHRDILRLWRSGHVSEYDARQAAAAEDRRRYDIAIVDPGYLVPGWEESAERDRLAWLGTVAAAVKANPNIQVIAPADGPSRTHLGNA